MAIILNLGFIMGFISNFEISSQRDLNKTNYAQICKKNVFQTSSNKPPGRFQRN